jgi:hypothetical protein
MNSLIIPNDPKRWFNVMNGLPVTRISFAVVALYRARIESNHCASLEMLNETGGLDWYELWCGFHDAPLFPRPKQRREALMRDDVLAVVAGNATNSQ